MKENGSTFSFGTDFHGNLQNIDRFLSISKERDVDHVIFGGDLAPKKMAIQLSDGKALTPIYHRTSGIPTLFYQTPQRLHDQGFILFESSFDKPTLEHLLSIHSKLKDYTQGSQSKDIKKIILTDSEIQTVEEHLTLLLSDALNNDVSGAKIFSLFCETYSKIYPKRPPYTVDRFLQTLLLIFKYDSLVSKGWLMDPKIRDPLFFGKTNASSQELAKVLEQTHELLAVGLDHFYHYWASSPKLFPWIQWEETNRQLHTVSFSGQKRFIQEFLQRIQDFRKNFRGTVSAILGNDDQTELAADLDEADRLGILTHATDRVAQLAPDTQIIGYSHVPTPLDALYLDWVRSEEEMREDLDRISQQIRQGVRYTLCNFHCPPSQTELCRAIVPEMDQTDFGSESIRNFIRETQPTVALTGHIHKSWKITGHVRDRIGLSAIFNPGDSEYEPHFIVGNLDKPEQFEWIKPDDNG